MKAKEELLICLLAIHSSIKDWWLLAVGYRFWLHQTQSILLFASFSSLSLYSLSASWGRNSITLSSTNEPNQRERERQADAPRAGKLMEWKSINEAAFSLMNAAGFIWLISFIPRGGATSQFKNLLIGWGRARPPFFSIQLQSINEINWIDCWMKEERVCLALGAQPS